jgi:hypothetical protein
MITVEGAKLLAQFIPVLILILAVERRTLGPEPEPVRRTGWIWYWLKGIGQSFGAAVALLSMAPLIIFVNENRTIDGFYAVMILVSVLLTGQAVIGVVISLVFRGYFGHEQTALGEEIRRQKAQEVEATRRYRRARRRAQRRIAVKGR